MRRQAAGQLPVDVRALDVDFYLGGGLKWLLGGTGVAFLYARPDLLAALRPSVTGWFAHREQFKFDPRAFEFHDDARRLEAGTPPLMPVYAQLGGLDNTNSSSTGIFVGAFAQPGGSVRDSEAIVASRSS